MVQADKLYQQFEKDALAKLLGIQIIDIQPGYARTHLEVNSNLVNALGMTHGSTVFALVDMALAAASNSRDKVAVAQNVSIHFMKATHPGDQLYATATEENLTNRTGIYRIVVENEAGEKIAVATGTAYRTGSGH
ncbi:MAG: hotdog fold thioesterase [Bacillota bacterium]